ncbi:hypothetical protein RDWZM_000654 [Blomia tropicalis]|uniref:Bromo domain-containing protein n=1 Tax=Blomia tropicalis TaxID=40697 RepID=A0A9Q0MAZ0_BLOTA|nr:hypothetical protein RDWZM_000654 [Blomia tropicalis]
MAHEEPKLKNVSVASSLVQQPPIDVWTTREKLILATNVKGGGDRNWNAVVRKHQNVDVENRPSNWFTTKFCAQQCRVLLDEVEVPKRSTKSRKDNLEKRPDEQVSTTAIDIVVRNLTSQHINELTSKITGEITEFCDLFKNFETLKSGKYDSKFFDQMCDYYKEYKQKKKIDEEEYKKWLIGREEKIAKMSRTSKKNIKPAQPAPQKKLAVEPILVVEEAKPIIEENVSNLKPNVEKTSNSIEDSSTNILQSSSNLSPTKLSSRPSTNTIEDKNIQPIVSNDKDDDSKQEVAIEVDEEVSRVVTPSNSDSMDSNASALVESENKVEMPVNSEATTLDDMSVEQENSNDTIEETFENIDDKPNSEDKQKTDITLEDVSRLLAQELPAGEPLSNTKTSEKTFEEVDNHIEPTIKDEDENTISILDEKDAILNVNNDVSSYEKAKRKRKSKTPNVTPIQTRSTRSQSSIKSEETKEMIVKVDSTKQFVKKSLNSADEGSADNTISEESNDGKSSTNDSFQKDDIETKKWKLTARNILKNIKNILSAAPFFKPVAEELYQHVVHREMNLDLIKKRIENGEIKNMLELKRDFLLISSNAIMFNHYDNHIYKAAKEFGNEIVQYLEDEQKPTRSRKRSSKSPKTRAIPKRRKTRGSITFESKSASKKKN